MITKSAYDVGNFSNDLVCTRSARDAWKLILNTVKSEHNYLNILLPAYIGFTDREGSGIFDPVESTAAKFGFYKVNEDLSIDYDNLQHLIANNTFNVLLVVHYFGFCRNDLPKLKQICEDNNIILVEDCAHAYHLGQKKEGLGVDGDFSFYSVHKYLPVQSGGILKNISAKLKTLPVPEQDKMEEQVLFQLLKSNIVSIADKRRHNFQLYYDKLSEVNGIDIMYNLKDDEIPQTFPILVKNNQREALYFYLMERELPTTALYYRLIDHLVAQEFPISFRISNEILNLPVHQDVNDKDIYDLVSAIGQFFTLRK